MKTIQNIIKDFERIGYAISYSNRLFNHVMKKGEKLVMFKFIDDQIYYLFFDHEQNVSSNRLNLYFHGPDAAYDEPRFGSDLEAEFDIVDRYQMRHLGNHIGRGVL